MMKALALLSGGLDSILAARVIMEQGIEVAGLCFVTPFFGPESARRAARQLGIELIEHDLTTEFFEMMRNPRYGFGGNMNPCIDCHGLMLKTAHGLLGKYGASFLITGEVLGERPMSQTRGGLNAVLKLAADRDLVLRPLSAKLLETTRPEREGWVDRERLLDFSGRGRKRQEEMARKFGITDYPQPAGGCLLTDIKFSRRLKELLAHEGFVREDIELLKLGRHFRLGPGTKLAVGRNQAENVRLLESAGPSDTVLRPERPVKGPVGLLRGAADGEVLEAAAGIVGRYCDEDGGGGVTVAIYRNNGRTGELKARIWTDSEVLGQMI
jgi:tRNA U34 2-thiouridine synthase MnmA/TrmU